MNGRRGTREVVDLVHFQQYWLDHIVTQQLQPSLVEQVKNVFPPPGEEVVQTKYIVVFVEQPFTQMRANKSCAAGYQDSHA